MSNVINLADARNARIPVLDACAPVTRSRPQFWRFLAIAVCLQLTAFYFWG